MAMHERHVQEIFNGKDVSVADLAILHAANYGASISMHRRSPEEIEAREKQARDRRQKEHDKYKQMFDNIDAMDDKEADERAYVGYQTALDDWHSWCNRILSGRSRCVEIMQQVAAWEPPDTDPAFAAIKSEILNELQNALVDPDDQTFLSTPPRCMSGAELRRMERGNLSQKLQDFEGEQRNRMDERARWAPFFESLGFPLPERGRNES